jgi:uncharacterized secreted protein with C-terminal beta-propeller domain
MNLRRLFSAFLVSLFIAGCFPGNDNNTGSQAGVGDVDKNRAPGVLVKADEAELTAYFRTALASDANEGSANKGSNLELAGAPVAADAASSASGGAAGGLVSSTNLQEAGVDEAAQIKVARDGRTIYSIFPNSDRYYGGLLPVDGGKQAPPEKFEEGIRIMSVQDDGSLTEVRRVMIEEGDQRQKGLYLVEARKKLIAVGESGGNVYAYWFRPYWFSRQKTQLRFIDISEPAQASVTRKMEFDGALVSSRRVGDVLYLVLRHYPDVPRPLGQPVTTQEENGNETSLTTVTAEKVLPKYSVDGLDQGLLVKPDACYVNRNAARKSADIITIVAVDLATDNAAISSRCYVGSSEALYASPNALYLSSTRHDYDYSATTFAYDPGMTTDIHKFAFDGMDIEYRGSAEVKGHLGWDQDRKSFRFSESSDGYLRVITYNEQRQFLFQPVDIAVGGDVGDEVAVAPPADGGKAAEQQSPVLLTILRESDNREALEVVSTLPNAAHPEFLGRPGEQLYGSRYVGDRAYLITFRVTDPLYVLDLSDPANPYKVGELKISGYSDYLHPINENLLLGVGKEAIPADGSIFGDFGGAWYQGVKLSLIDVSDPANPKEVDKLEIGKRGTQSPALHNHHAITTLQVGRQLRVALPVALHDQDTPDYGGDRLAPNYYYGYTHTGLYRFNVDIDSQTIDATPKPLIVEQRDDSGNYYGGNIEQDRSVMVGDHVHYLHRGRFWSQHWQNNVVTGPE